MSMPSYPSRLRLLVLVGLLALGGGCDSGGPGGPPPAAEAPEASPAQPSASAPPATVPGVGEVRIEMLRGKDPQERIVIGDGGLALGPAGGPLSRLLFATPERLEDLKVFSQTYAPFQVRDTTPAGTLQLVFRGRGRTRPGPAERRMILEWARHTATEAVRGRGRPPYGLALAWHRGAGPGNCEEVSVFLTGEVRASSCGGREEISGRLATGPLTRLYAWFDRLKPVQVSGGVSEGRIESAQRLIFAGRGSQDAAPGDVQALQAFAAALHRELAARRGDPLPAQPGPLPEPGRNRRTLAEASEASEPAAGPSLLLPPRPPGRSLREVVIPQEAMPRQPPPIPERPPEGPGVKTQ
ncbi:MAG TPA: hypothetical protein VL025_11185 [Thermoanaerobaculia bacterium]|nr:hypothetical protein [Thermoanaerobaculia bacterium]